MYNPYFNLKVFYTKKIKIKKPGFGSMQNKYCSNQEESRDPLQTGMSNSQYFGPNLRTAGDNPMFNVKGNAKMKRSRDNFS